MTDTIKVSRLTRELEVSDIQMTRDAKGPVKISFSASSEYPVERYFGTEVLDHSPAAVRLDRAKKRAMPLLFNHDMGDPIGMVDAATVGDGRMLIEAHLFDTVRAREVESMMRDGLRNVSIGYRIFSVEEQKKTDTMIVREWEPFEASIVTVPADPTVGLGRAADGQQEFEVRILRAQIERRCTCGAATSAAMMGTHSDSCPQYQRLPDTCYCGEAAPVPGSKHVACAKSYAAGLNDRESEF